MSKEMQFENVNNLLAYMAGGQYIQPNQQPKQENKMDKTTQTSMMAATRQGAFIVGSVDAQGAVSFSSSPVAHITPQSARTECKRLSTINPGKAFIFVKLAGAELVPVTQNISI